MCDFKKIVVVLFLMLSCSLQAQRVFQMIYFQKPKGAPDSLKLYVNGVLDGDVVLRDHVFSHNYTIKNKGDLVLHFTDKEYDDIETIEKFPSVKIPASYSKFVLLAHTDRKIPVLPMKFTVLNASDFKEGDFKFINLTNYRLDGIIGSQKFQLLPKKVKTYRNIARPAADYKMNIDVLMPETKFKKFKLMSKLLRYNHRFRTLFFVYQPSGRKYPTYQSAEVRGL